MKVRPYRVSVGKEDFGPPGDLAAQGCWTRAGARRAAASLGGCVAAAARTRSPPTERSPSASGLLGLAHKMCAVGLYSTRFTAWQLWFYFISWKIKVTRSVCTSDGPTGRSWMYHRWLSQEDVLKGDGQLLKKNFFRAFMVIMSVSKVWCSRVCQTKLGQRFSANIAGVVLFLFKRKDTFESIRTHSASLV